MTAARAMRISVMLLLLSGAGFTQQSTEASEGGISEARRSIDNLKRQYIRDLVTDGRLKPELERTTAYRPGLFLDYMPTAYLYSAPESPRYFIGISLETSERKAARIDSINGLSPAAHSRLREGDLIFEVNGQPYTDVGGLRA